MPESQQPPTDPDSPDDASPDGGAARIPPQAVLPEGVRVERLVPWEETGDGVTLLVPRFGAGRFGKWLARILRKGPIRVRLDETGSRVWRQLEPGRTVGEVVKALGVEERGDAADLSLRLDRFLLQLYRSGCIRLGKPFGDP